jgi:hypothetical protein
MEQELSAGLCLWPACGRAPSEPSINRHRRPQDEPA